MRSDDKVLIHELVERGRFVAVMEQPTFAPETRERIGISLHYFGDFATREEAEGILHEMWPVTGVRLTVMPEIPEPFSFDEEPPF